VSPQGPTIVGTGNGTSEVPELPSAWGCVMAGAKPIASKIGETAQGYRATHNAGQEYQEYDAPLEIQDTHMGSGDNVARTLSMVFRIC
jgi:hypothetical protein